MGYATQEDLVNERIPEHELAELTDDGDGGTIDEAVVTNAIDEASATIDSYACARYTVPLQASVMVKKLCLDLTTHALFSRRRKAPETVVKAYDSAIKFLENVSVGKAQLASSTVTPQAPSAGGAVNPSRKPQVFGDDNLRGW